MDWFCAGFDSVVYFRALGSAVFYHGFGHWSQLRYEFKLNEYSNLKFLKNTWPEKVDGGTLKIRFLDQDLLTTGLDLFVQDKESSGGRIDLIFDQVSLVFKGESTGAFFINDDLYNFEVKENNDRFGVGTVIFNVAKDQGRFENHLPYYYIFSSQISRTSIRC